MEVNVHPRKISETKVCVCLCLKLCVAYLNTAPYNYLAEHLVNGYPTLLTAFLRTGTESVDVQGCRFYRLTEYIRG